MLQRTFHPHPTDGTILVIVTSSLHLVDPKCEFKALFLNDLSSI